MENDFPEGIARTVYFLEDSIKKSEENAVRHGTSAAEAEQHLVEMVRKIAAVFGGDITDQQWWAGMASMISVFATYGDHSPMVGMIMDSVVADVAMAVARLHDNVLKEGVVIFDGK